MAVFQTEFFSECLGRRIPITVCLPADSAQNRGKYNDAKTYKTVYLLHGIYGNNNSWLHHGNVEEVSEQFDVAIVLPSGENSFYLDHAKRFTLFSKLIGEEIVAFTRSVFPLSDRREDTILGGLSMGGYGATLNGLKYSEVFGAIFAFSSAYIIDMMSHPTPENKDSLFSYEYCLDTFGNPGELLGSACDYKAEVEKLLKEGRTPPATYISCGTEDFLIEHNRDFIAFLKEKGYPHTYVESAGVHDWVFWREYIVKALQWYLA